MIELPKIYSQKDAKWAIRGLGFDPRYTIGSDGCLISCLSMIACLNGFDETPETMNEKLKKINGFLGAEYRWGSFTSLFGIPEKRTRTNFRLKNENMAEIRNAVKSGNPVMLWIDYNPKTARNDMHWVLAVDYDDQDENNITIIDPIDGQEKSLKKYLGWFIKDARRTIEAYVIYETQKKEVGEEPAEYGNIIKEIEDILKKKFTNKTKIEKIKNLINAITRELA